jgi:hypothetical protein
MDTKARCKPLDDWHFFAAAMAGVPFGVLTPMADAPSVEHPGSAGLARGRLCAGRVRAAQYSARGRSGRPRRSSAARHSLWPACAASLAIPCGLPVALSGSPGAVGPVSRRKPLVASRAGHAGACRALSPCRCRSTASRRCGPRLRAWAVRRADQSCLPLPVRCTASLRPRR